MLGLGKGDHAWRKVSSTLEADSKIFGLRVDAFHNDTYKVVHGLGRSNANGDESSLMEAKNSRNISFDFEGMMEKIESELSSGNFGNSTIDRHAYNINVDNLEYQFDFNPFF